MLSINFLYISLKIINFTSFNHYEVGQKVKKAIAGIGGMMSEEMSSPKRSLKELEREKKQLETKEQKN